MNKKDRVLIIIWIVVLILMGIPDWIEFLSR